MLINSQIAITQYPDTFIFNMNCAFYVPDSYNGTDRLPVIFFGHGSGAAGNNIAQLYTEASLPALLKMGFVPPFPCIIIMIQAQSYGIRPSWLPYPLGQIQDSITISGKKYLTDRTRVYLTGLSAGGYMCFGSQLNVFRGFGSNFAAIVSMSAATQDAIQSNLALGWWTAPTWNIVGDKDPFYNYDNQLMSAIGTYNPSLVVQSTLIPGFGHGPWTNIYNGSVMDGSGRSLWSFLLSFKLGTAPPPPLSVAAVSIAYADGTAETTAKPVRSATITMTDGTVITKP